jgi:mRNA interferase MazF
MKRGDVVVVAAAGDYGKPRPAVVVQTDAFPEAHASVVICQMTSEIVDAPDFRPTIEPAPENGLRVRSQITADKPVTVRRERTGQVIGRLAGGHLPSQCRHRVCDGTCGLKASFGYPLT